MKIELTRPATRFLLPLFLGLSGSAGASTRAPRYTRDDIRTIAAEGLALCATAASYDTVAKAFGSARPHKKQYLALALGRIGEKRAIPLLRAQLAGMHTFTVPRRQPGGREDEGWALVKGTDGVPVFLQLAYVAALEHLGDKSWQEYLLEQVRREKPEKPPPVRLAIFLDRYGRIPNVHERYRTEASVGAVLGKAFLDERLPAADRKLAARAATTIYRKDMSPYGRAYLERIQEKGLPMDPDTLRENNPDAAQLADSAFNLLMAGPTRADLSVLRKCAAVASWRPRLASKALTSIGDPDLLALAVRCLPYTGHYGPYERAYRFRTDVRPEYADFLLAEIADVRYSQRVRDALIMLLAKTGERRAIPLIKGRIGGKGAWSAISRAVEFLPSPEFVEPLFEARRRGWYSGVFSDSCYPLLGTLVALRDRRAIPIILEHLEGKAGHDLGGNWEPDKGYFWYPWQYVRPEAVYEPRSRRKPQVYRYVSVEYLHKLDAKETIPALRRIVESCLAKKPSRYDVPSGAKQALVSLGALQAPGALDLVERAFPVMPDAARFALLKINTPQAWKAMARLCTGTDWEIAVLLHERGDYSGIDKVITAALDPADTKYESALDALKRLADAVHHERARETVVSILTRPGRLKDSGDALLVGGYTRLPEVVPFLIAAYKTSKDDQRGRRNKVGFLRAIARNGGGRAEQFLCKVLESP